MGISIIVIVSYYLNIFFFIGPLTNVFLMPPPTSLQEVNTPRHCIIRPFQRHLYIPSDGTDDSDNTVTMMFNEPIQVLVCLIIMQGIVDYSDWVLAISIYNIIYITGAEPVVDTPLIWHGDLLSTELLFEYIWGWGGGHWAKKVI